MVRATMGGKLGTTHKDKKKMLPIGAEEFVEKQVSAILTGKAVGVKCLAGPPTTRDREVWARVVGMTAEEFNDHAQKKLRGVIDLAANRILEKLESDEFKPGELAYVLSVAHDKFSSQNGKAGIAGAQVNVQINNYGGETKEQVIARILGDAVKTKDTGADVI